MALVQKIFGDPQKKEIKKLEPLVHAINEREADFEKLSQTDLSGKTKDGQSFFVQIKENKRTDEKWLISAFPDD